MEEITIKIYRASDEEGYFYDIFDTNELEQDPDCDSLDGGLCTGSMINAVEMAKDQLETILNQNK